MTQAPPKTNGPRSAIPFDKLLSDELTCWRKAWAEFSVTGVTLPPEHVAEIVREIDGLRALARQYENEISRMAWNASAAAERNANRAFARALNDTSGKVVIFPVREMPLWPENTEGS